MFSFFPRSMLLLSLYPLRIALLCLGIITVSPLSCQRRRKKRLSQRLACPPPRSTANESWMDPLLRNATPRNHCALVGLLARGVGAAAHNRRPSGYSPNVCGHLKREEGTGRWGGGGYFDPHSTLDAHQSLSIQSFMFIHPLPSGLPQDGRLEVYCACRGAEPGPLPNRVK